MKVTRESLEENVLKWADDKGLTNKDNAEKQVLKFVSEVGELADAILKGNEADILDAIGDCEVVLTILKKIKGYEQDVPLALAWKEIEHRTGTTVDGVFIKED